MKKFLIVILLFVVTGSSFSQLSVNQNYPKFDKKWFHFGFALGINASTFTHRLKLDPTFSDSLLNFRVKPQPGIHIGVITSFKLHETLRIRIIPGFSFYTRELNYVFRNSDGTTRDKSYKSSSTSLDFPLLLKWRTLRVKNFAAYVIGGAQYSLDLAAKEKAKQSLAKPLVKTLRHDIGATIGLGVDFFMPYFKFGIELRMTHSVRNVLLQENFYLDRPIDKLYNRVWLVSFTFEG